LRAPASKYTLSLVLSTIHMSCVAFDGSMVMPVGLPPPLDIVQLPCKVPETNGTVESQVYSGTAFTKFAAQFVSGFLHELVAMAAAFENAGFEAAGAVGNFAGGDLPEHQAQVSVQR